MINWLFTESAAFSWFDLIRCFRSTSQSLYSGESGMMAVMVGKGKGKMGIGVMGVIGGMGVIAEAQKGIW